MADEPYEILPYREVSSLKKDISDLKQKMGDGSSKQLADSIANLSKTMENMLNLFQSAAEEMRLEEKGVSSDSSAILAEIDNKLDELIDQNKTIAEGIVAVADMIKGETQQSEQEQNVMPAQFSMPPPGPAPSFGPRPMEMPEPIPTPLGAFPPPTERPKRSFF